ncbi:MAG: FAD-binding oxidoreductase, partial [Deltaproteobacteria bacterium]|nr:FAD-binding oxidoreductase [Deltaproteobacteria bacterium]
MAYATELTAGHRAFLEKLLGGGVSFDKRVIAVHATDASLRSGEIFAVLRPSTVAQVQAILRWADEERIVVHTRGRGTSLAGGCVPTVPGVALSTMALDAILDISATDFVADVQPGVCTAVFQAECEKLGLMYPPDPA